MYEQYKHLPLIHAGRWSKRLGRGRISFEDLLSWANEGLLLALRDYDERRGAAFESYAYRRMDGAVQDGLRSIVDGGRSKFRKPMICATDCFSVDDKNAFFRLESGEDQLFLVEEADLFDFLGRGLNRRDKLILQLKYREGLSDLEAGRVIGI
ncbi:MAG: sigma factor [Patescibacteria group bacterium]